MPYSGPSKLGMYSGEQIVSQLSGRFYEMAWRGNVFTASQAATGSTIVAANVSPVGAGAAALFTLYNPATNIKNAVLLRTVINGISGTPGGGFVYNVIAPPAGITASANIVPISNNTLYAAQSSVVVISQSALTNSVLAKMFRPLGGPAAVASGAGLYGVTDYPDGDLIVPPGGAVLIAATATGTTHIVCCSFTWAEVPV